MQAWPTQTGVEVRRKQVDILASFMKNMAIPEREPVLLCGDLNMDLYANNADLKHLLFALDMDMPTISGHSNPYTVDPTLNILVGSDDPSAYTSPEFPKGCVAEYLQTLKCPCCPSEWLDYVLFSKKGLQPVESRLTAIAAKVERFAMPFVQARLQVESQDVSDHFPVIADFTFEYNWQHADARKVAIAGDFHVRANYALGIALLSLALFVFLLVGFAIRIIYTRIFSKSRASKTCIINGNEQLHFLRPD
jgi:hypothetical protein